MMGDGVMDGRLAAECATRAREMTEAGWHASSRVLEEAGEMLGRPTSENEPTRMEKVARNCAIHAGRRRADGFEGAADALEAAGIALGARQGAPGTGPLGHVGQRARHEDPA